MKKYYLIHSEIVAMARQNGEVERLQVRRSIVLSSLFSTLFLTMKKSVSPPGLREKHKKIFAFNQSLNMLKKTMFLFLILLSGITANAQTRNEWFKQKKTQTKYLIDQIAALRVYLGNLKKGYDIASKGLNTIENIKNGTVSLHHDFFSSLKSVNPAISNSAKVADIIAFQFYIIREMKSVYTFCKNNKNFSPEELRYIAQVLTNMLLLCDANISELLAIIRVNDLEMKDDERIQRIDKIYEDTLDKHAFVQAFGNDTKALAHAREKEQTEITLLKTNHEI